MVAVLTCALGAFVGLVNGVLIARFKVPAFVATFGVMYVARGVALLITNGLTYNNLARQSRARKHRASTGLASIACLAFRSAWSCWSVIAIIGSLVLNRDCLWSVALRLRRQRTCGGTLRRAGEDGEGRRSTCSRGSAPAIAGLILSSQLTSAGPTAGTSYELTAIAAVVIGGAALTGGRGNIRGTLLGAFVIGFLSDGLVIIGISSYWQTVFTGAVIVLAVLLNAVQYRRRVKPPSSTDGPSTSQQQGGKARKSRCPLLRRLPVDRSHR